MITSVFPTSVEVNIKDENLLKHFNVCQLLGNLYKSKNNDYGDSFHKTYEEFGPIALAVRLRDKVNRLSSLTASKKTDGNGRVYS